MSPNSTLSPPALHATTPDYHTSGAWIAVAAAAAGARLLNLGPDQTAHALGIAEYHGPRSQMMRCIDHPTMLKDGSGWGAMAGVSAALLARAGFTGAPALTLERPHPLWDDLGDRWLICAQYFKPYPVCRWAQAPIEAILALRRAHRCPPTCGAIPVPARRTCSRQCAKCCWSRGRRWAGWMPAPAFRRSLTSAGRPC